MKITISHTAEERREAEMIEAFTTGLVPDAAIQKSEYNFVQTVLLAAPTVDAVEVPDKKLLRAMKLLIKQYEHSKQSDYVHSPVAHALFHTWKQVDERRTDNEKS